MDRILELAVAIGLAFVGSWLFWQWKNLRKLKVSIETRGVVASIPIQPCEEHIIQVTITNVGRKAVNVKQCWFTVDGQRQHIVVDRRRLLTMPEDLPTKLEPDEQCVIGYPAHGLYGHRLSCVIVEDFLGNRWRATGGGVRRASAELEKYQIAA